MVCREHQTESRYSEYKKNPVCICSSLGCPDPLACFVCQAARATSAAPTYFPIQKIDGRSFADGGIEFNNPSFEIYYHYSEVVRVAGSQRTSIASRIELPVGYSGARHGNLDFSRMRIINLGTGSEPHVTENPEPGFFAKLMPAPVRMAVFLKKTLMKTATESERVAKHMRVLARVSGSDSQMAQVDYVRFSENNGICYVELDKYKELERIKEKTRAYLQTTSTQNRIKRVASEMAADYLHGKPPQLRPITLTVPGNVPPSQYASSQSSRREALYTVTASPSTMRISDESSGANSTVSQPSNNPDDDRNTPTPVMPPQVSTEISGPAESMIATRERELEVLA